MIAPRRPGRAPRARASARAASRSPAPVRWWRVSWFPSWNGSAGRGNRSYLVRLGGACPRAPAGKRRRGGRRARARRRRAGAAMPPRPVGSVCVSGSRWPAAAEEVGSPAAPVAGRRELRRDVRRRGRDVRPVARRAGVAAVHAASRGRGRGRRRHRGSLSRRRRRGQRGLGRRDRWRDRSGRRGGGGAARREPSAYADRRRGGGGAIGWRRRRLAVSARGAGAAATGPTYCASPKPRMGMNTMLNSHRPMPVPGPCRKHLAMSRQPKRNSTNMAMPRMKPTTVSTTAGCTREGPEPPARAADDLYPDPPVVDRDDGGPAGPARLHIHLPQPDTATT